MPVRRAGLNADTGPVPDEDDGAVALGPYKDSLRALCLRIKDEPHAWLVPWLTDLLVEKQGEALRGRGADLVAAIPLHWTRRFRRGYDQAQTIAAALASQLQGRVRDS